MFSKKYGVNAEVLEKTLWGDFYLEAKTKRIKKGALVRISTSKQIEDVKIDVFRVDVVRVQN